MILYEDQIAQIIRGSSADGPQMIRGCKTTLALVLRSGFRGTDFVPVIIFNEPQQYRL